MAQSKVNLNERYNTGLISDFQKSLSETSTNQSNVGYWEELLQPAQQTYEQTTEQAQLASGYDITNAYKQYLSQQRGIEGSSLLDASKSEFKNLSKSQYQSSYAQSQSTLMSNLASAYEQYTKDYQKAYEQLQKESEYTKSIYENALEIASSYSEDNRYTEEELNNMYALNTSTGKYELTDIGKIILGDVFESVDETTNQNVLAKTLKETDEDLYQYYLENKSRVTEALAGYKGTYDYETGKEEYYDKLSKERGGIMFVKDIDKPVYINNVKYERFIPEKNPRMSSQLSVVDPIGPITSLRQVFNGTTESAINEYKKQKNPIYQLSKNKKVGDVFEYDGYYYIKVRDENRTSDVELLLSDEQKKNYKE